MRTLVIILAAIALWLLGRPAFGQVPQFPFSFTSQPVNLSERNIYLLSTSAIGVSSLTIDQATGNPFGTNGTLIQMDIEADRVTSVPRPGVTLVERGVQGTRTATHGALSKVWIATARYFLNQNPAGKCNPFAVTVRPVVVIPSGSVFDCFAGSGQSWKQSKYPWTEAKFAWSAPVDQGTWKRIPVEQGDWAVAAIAWKNATFQWKQIAKARP